MVVAVYVKLLEARCHTRRLVGFIGTQISNPETQATADRIDPCPARAVHRPGAYAPSTPCVTRITSWFCGPDFAARAGTVDVNSAYARANFYPASAQSPRSQPQEQAAYVDDTRHFVPAAPEAHRW